MAKIAILALLAESNDGAYWSCAEIAREAFSRWGIASKAIKSELNSRMQGLFDEVSVPSDPRIRWRFPTVKLYRLRRDT